MNSPTKKTLLISLAAVVGGGLLTIAVWYYDLLHAPAEKVLALHGRSESDILKQLGQPTSELVFTMDNAEGEFRIELYNTYPPGAPNNNNVHIRECTWDYSRHKLTVWFHKPDEDGNWVALDTCRYQNGIAF